MNNLRLIVAAQRAGVRLEARRIRAQEEMVKLDARFITYLVVSAILIVTPGPDMARVARNAVKGGYAAARSTAFGVGAGILLWGVFSAVGLAAAFAASAAVFSGVKLIGALFLMILGVRCLWAAMR